MFYRMAHGISRERRVRTGLAATAAAVLLWGTPTAASAGSAGGTLFHTYCAACHGADARGNGPVAGVLRVQPPDLTLLTRRFGTPLNRDRVAEYIDGRVSVMAHGPRDMPVWGNRLQDELIGRPATEDTIRRMIDSIVMYLVSIQQIRGAVR
jgi:mono/diheme cytochrome c family protein